MPNENQHEYTLHIIETVELELGLNILDTGDYDTSNIIHLKKDAAVPSRYWCLHNTGVHGVTIPLAELLDEFSNCDATGMITNSLWIFFFFFYIIERKAKLREISGDCRKSPDIQGQSFVEYYICTGLMNGETKPIKGFAVINFPTDLLVTLLSNGEVVTQTIPDYLHNKASIANMYINEDNATEDDTDNPENVR